MNSKFISVVIILIVAFANSSCATKSDQKLSEFSDSLVTVKGAFNIKYTKLNGTQQVTYSIVAQYPASNVISEINNQLKIKGWSALEKDWLNPQIPTSHVRGWTNFIDETKDPNQEVHSWNSNWENAQGDILIYVLTYSNPLKTESNMSDLKILAIFIPEEIVKESMSQVRNIQQRQGG